MVILFDRFNLPEDVYEIIFSTESQRIVADLLINELKKYNGEMTKSEMSKFATELHDGQVIALIRKGKNMGKKGQLSYNKRQFYDRILTPMKGMGLIDYDLYKKVYRLSDKFSKALTKIGLEWIRELQKEYISDDEWLKEFNSKSNIN